MIENKIKREEKDTLIIAEQIKLYPSDEEMTTGKNKLSRIFGRAKNKEINTKKAKGDLKKEW